ncbi:hypothetical protein NSND_60808 [Nitrospira sp. ND1]|nr:hypothetical protein NSND_60808 [Nitrospira sp. ND1]
MCSMCPPFTGGYGAKGGILSEGRGEAADPGSVLAERAP